MTDEKPSHRDRLKGILNQEQANERAVAKEPESDAGEASCGAFGYLRGLRDQTGAVEFRFRDGNSTWFPYNLLGPWRYNPSEGLLLKFSGDVTYLVLIKGSNLAMPLSEGTINLTTGGLQRHKITWIREMSEAEIKDIGETGPTIDSIQVAEFESPGEVKAWLREHAPAFLN